MDHTIPSPTDIYDARLRISSRLSVTPLTYSEELSHLLNRPLWIKWDNKFKTGSFKERGALNFLLKLKDRQSNLAVCTASAGNHALAVAWHTQQLGIPCKIVMPKFAPLVKAKMTARYGADVILSGNNFDEAYSQAKDIAEAENLVFIPGFDHEDIIAGQGVSGLEIYEQTQNQVDAIVVPIGGGGLAAGIALAIKSINPDVYILGVRSEWVNQEKTNTSFPPAPIADGIAVKTMGKITSQIINQLVNDIVFIPEHTISNSIISYLHSEHTVIEGAGAAALAAVMSGHLPDKYKHPVVLACGSNIDLNVLARLIQRKQFQEGQLLKVSVSVPDRPGSLAKLTSSISEAKANVLETYHERSFSEHPGNVDITFMLETRDNTHKTEILQTLSKLGLNPKEV